MSIPPQKKPLEINNRGKALAQNLSYLLVCQTLCGGDLWRSKLTVEPCSHGTSLSSAQVSVPGTAEPSDRTAAGGAVTELQLRGSVARWRYGTARRGSGWDGAGWNEMGWERME